MKKTLLVIILLLFITPKFMCSDLDDGTLRGIEKINEIMFLVSNFYVENKSPQQIFIGAAEGMIRRLGAGAELFHDLKGYEEYKKRGGDSLKSGINFLARGGWNQVVNVHDFGLFLNLGLMPGDILYNIGDKYLDNMTADELIMTIYRAMLEKKGLKLTLKRANLTVPTDIDLDKDPDYSAYDLKKADIETLENDALSGSPNFILADRLKLKRDAMVDHIVLNNLSVIKIRALNSKTYPVFHEYLAKANNISRVLALDLRNCSSSSFESIKPFLRLFIKNRYIGYYEVKNGKKNKLYIGEEDIEPLNSLPVTVFISRQTYWYAEFFAQLLKDHINAYIIGEKSFGRGDYKELYSILDGRYFLLISTGKLYTLKSRTAYKDGVMIDKEINPADIIYTDEEYRDFLYSAQERISSLIR